MAIDPSRWAWRPPNPASREISWPVSLRLGSSPICSAKRRAGSAQIRVGMGDQDQTDTDQYYRPQRPLHREHGQQPALVLIRRGPEPTAPAR